MRTSGKEMKMNMYRIQDLGSIMCGYFCIYMINEMCKGRKWYGALCEFDPNNYNKNDKIVMKKLQII